MHTFNPCLKLATLLVLAASTALPAAAQATSGPTSTVVYAAGDDLVVKAADGKLLNFTVPAGYKFSAGGKQVSLGDLKPGDKLSAPVTAGTPEIVTSVAVVKGKVYGVTPPDGVTLSLAEGTKDLAVPAGTTFMVDGKKLAVADLKPNMMVEATIVSIAADGASATATPTQAGALLVARAAAAEDLPAAATDLPLFGALGLVCLSLGAALLARRKPAATRS
jgi:hypothetical protein